MLSSRTRSLQGARWSILFAVAVVGWPLPVVGEHPRIAFDELTHTADAIFIGEVAKMHSYFNAKGSSIFTDVTFKDVQLIHRGPLCTQDIGDRVTLTYAGGQVGDIGLTVSDMPRFEVGQKALVFSLMDGKTYVNPFVGGPQGLFRVAADPLTQREHVLTAGRRGVVGVAGGRLRTRRRVERIENGVVTAAPSPADRIAADPKVESTDPRASAERRTPPPEEPVLTLDEFVDGIHSTLAAPAPADPVLGSFRNETPADADQSSAPPPASPLPAMIEHVNNHRVPLADEAAVEPHESQPPSENDVITTGQTVSYCGYFDLPIIMDQRPASSPAYEPNFDCMGEYNELMHIYNYRNWDGGFGSNFYSEFSGFLTESQLDDAYGTSWGTAIAKCATWYLWCHCCEIYEADVMFKAGLDWRYNFDETLGVSGTTFYQSVCMHELGHSWGMMRTDEEYNYDIPTVMHAYYSNIVEDGKGLHFWDAYALRAIYHDQTSVDYHQDVGVESYYADEGLNNATTDAASYNPGDVITISGITVENMSTIDAPGVRVEASLSYQRDGGGWRWPLNGSLYWANFAKDSYWTGNLSVTIPEDVTSSGNYYVILEVTANDDDFTWEYYPDNNTTSLFDTIAVTCPAISAPTGLTASDGLHTSSVYLEWNEPAGAWTYELWRNDVNNASTATMIKENFVTSHWSDVPPVPGKDYYYWVKAVRVCDTPSGFSGGDVGYRALEPPVVTAADGEDYLVVEVTWPAVEGATHYQVYRSDTYDLSGAVPISPWQTWLNYGDPAPVPAKDYFYWVKPAVSSTGHNAPDLILEYVGVGSLAAPPPSNVNATDDDETHPDYVRITWDAATGATHYQVYRGVTDDPDASTDISPWQTALSFDDSTAAAGPIYYYWVKACKNQYGVQPTVYSSPDTGSRPAPPLPKPTSVIASDGTSTAHVTITWNAVSGATHYRVWRGFTIYSVLSGPVSGWITGTSYNHTTANPGQDGYYWVTAAADSQGSQESEHGGYNIGWRAITPPDGVSATDGTHTDRIQVTWNEVDTYSYGAYKVYRNTINDPGTATAVSDWQFETVYDDADPALTPGVSYWYWISAATGLSGNHPSALSVIPNSGYRKLSPPQDVAASDGTFSSLVQITWTGVEGASYYRVYRHTTKSSFDATPISGWLSGATSYDDSTAAVGQEYFYWVKAAINRDGDRPSNLSSHDRGYTAIAAPTGLAATDGTYTDSILINWTAAPDATHYRVYRGDDDNPNRASPLSGWIDTTSYYDATAVPGEVYYYWATAATDDAGDKESAFSNSDTGQRFVAPPLDVEATNGTYTGFVSVTWEPVKDATHYRLYRGISSNPATAIPITSWITSRSRNDTSATPGSPYYYSVKSATSSSGDNESPLSASDSGWRGLTPPTGVNAQDGIQKDRVEITWNAVPHANYYSVYRHTTPIAINATMIGDWQPETSFSDETAVTNTVYYYWVKASPNAAGSQASNFSVNDTGWRGYDCNDNGVPDPTETDTDTDGFIDDCDNCPDVWNDPQVDVDVDDVGDACDDCPNTVPNAVVDDRGCPPVIPGDYDGDGDVDAVDWDHFEACARGPDVLALHACQDADHDGDNDVDSTDFAAFQRCMSAENVPADPGCAG